jgi:endonuclease V-like protein UPF0215 family
MLPGPEKSIRVIGFDDAPFQRADTHVNVSGIVCSGTRFEGMLWGTAERDGFDATEVLIEMVKPSKFHPQLHAILLDGIAVGGLNLIDLPRLAEELALPCVAVMRKEPDLEAMKKVIGHLPEPSRRLELLERAGPIHTAPPFVFQVAGADVSVAEELLGRVTDTGHVPEALRLAHHIGSAVKTGSSKNRA